MYPFLFSCPTYFFPIYDKKKFLLIYYFLFFTGKFGQIPIRRQISDSVIKVAFRMIWSLVSRLVDIFN